MWHRYYKDEAVHTRDCTFKVRRESTRRPPTSSAVMPRVSRRQELLDEVAAAHQSARLIRLQVLLAQFLNQDFDLLNDPLTALEALCDIPSPNSSTSSLSSISSISSVSSSSGSCRLGIDSDYEHQILDAWERHLQATQNEILITRVLQVLPPVPRVPQIQLLVHHRIYRPYRFRN